MERLEIAATRSSPAVRFDADARLFTIAGESYPENTAKFYLPLLKWLEEYFKSTDSEQAFVLTLDIPYCNSSSTKVLMDLLYLLDSAVAEGRAVTVKWLYDTHNENACETGEELQEDFECLTFDLIEKPADQ